MSVIRFKNYNLGYRIVSIALDECSKCELLENNLEIMYLNLEKNEVILLPENHILSNDEKIIEEIKEYSNFDVCEIWENGYLNRKYSDKSEDNYFFITGKCNSNCIMCPSPEYSRKNSGITQLNELLTLAKHIPSDASHLTITGGEPFLMGKKIFEFTDFLKGKFTNTEFLFLTNGRIFAIEDFTQLFLDYAPKHSIIAIPIHGSTALVHDKITRTKGSFDQTFKGIKNLLNRKLSVEIRLVVSKINCADFYKISELIVENFKGIEYVSVIAMEMTGTAWENKDEVWIPYKEAFHKISNAILNLIKNGIDVKLYNFPLCTVDSAYWTLCEKSISDNKVRFAEQCDSCKFKNSCSGVFAGTLNLEKNELKPIL